MKIREAAAGGRELHTSSYLRLIWRILGGVGFLQRTSVVSGTGLGTFNTLREEVIL